ncbi:unnamed protein product [Linum trigynum]|uniref:Uncharacterized protein n=1 Tax=Linum trigynum TaxID=586398 RepID=A0AAV2CYU9_9ROSI
MASISGAKLYGSNVCSGRYSSVPMSAPAGNSSAPMSARGEKSSAPGGKSSAPLSLAVNSSTNQIDQILTSTRIFGCELRYQSNNSESPGEKSWAPGAVGKWSALLSLAPALRAGIFDAISQVQDPSRQVGKSTQGAYWDSLLPVLRMRQSLRRMRDPVNVIKYQKLTAPLLIR